MKTKVTYILSNIDKAIAFEWISEKLSKDEFDLSFILLNDKEPFLYQWLQKNEIECYYIPFFGKKSYLKTFFKTFRLLQKIKPKVIHTHLFDANLIGLIVAKFLRIKKRIYTRHHSTFHHEYFPKAIKWDRFSNYLATDIVAISENVKRVLIEKENVCSEKIHLIHHGFDLDQFNQVSTSEINSLKNKYQLTDNTPVIGVISRFISWKGVQFIIPAFKQLLIDYPNSKLFLANSSGPYKTEIETILQKELDPNQYITASFEPNLFGLYRLFDVYVHTPINKDIEAFGQTYVEALAAGIPSVFTLSGVANEFITNRENAIVADYKESNQIYEAISTILIDQTLKKKLIQNGKKSVERFNLTLFINNLKSLYNL